MTILVIFIASLIASLGLFLTDLIAGLNIFLQILIYAGLFCGLSFLYMPFHYGALFSISFSEAIRPSKRGARYIVLASYLLITNIINIILKLLKGGDILPNIFIGLYAIILLALSRSFIRKNSYTP